MSSMQGKVALVTGAGSGLGRASAMMFAREGARVVVADIDVEGGEETTTMIKKAGGEAVFIKTDISKEADVKNMVAFTIKNYGRLDCAHNNAGVAQRGPMAEVTVEEWDRVIGINLKGTWLCMKHEIIQMLTQKSGAIVNTSSITGLIGAPTSGVYSASKWGINGLTKSAGVEYAKSGIRVNSICPAGIAGTKMTQSGNADPARQAMLTNAIPLGRMGTTTEIAAAAVFLCSDAAAYITAANLPVDGGGSAA